ncbi:MAG: UvrD-helicase domain-containing protein [Parcubacteria group bacterium]|nr:UvrD-helicase domain-containing protein [Parcubacteria group bacterium]
MFDNNLIFVLDLSRMTTNNLVLKDLSEKQAQAVKTVSGPVLIIAGPGSGKTRCLTHRIAYMIGSGIRADKILAVTFTNKAAQEIKDRVQKLIGAENNKFISLPSMGTFHSVCARILRDQAKTLGFTKNFTIYDEEDQLNLIKKSMESLELSPKKFNPYSILNKISALKSELVDSKMWANRADGYFEKITADVYDLYQRGLTKANAMDFDDLILNAVKLFQEHPDILEHYQNRFQFILVDEYQDTNTAQYIFTKLLAKKHKNLFVIGDTDQCVPGSQAVLTPNGLKAMEEIRIGDEVISASGRGRVLVDKVVNKRESDYVGPILEIETKGGNKVKLTPNHICFGRLKPHAKKYFVYLMYRKDKGYRVGITVGERFVKKGEAKVGLMVRSNQEFADKMWILKVCGSKPEAKFLEQLIAFKYGIPTTVFYTKGRGGTVIDQKYIDKIFEEIDTENRINILFKDFYLDKRFPHHRPQAGIRNSRQRISVNFTMFSHNGVRTKINAHRVSINTSDVVTINKLKSSDLGDYVRKGKFLDWRVELARFNYKDALAMAHKLADLTSQEIGLYALLSKGKRFLFLPASQIHEGFVLPIFKNGKIQEEEVKSVKWADFKGKLYDLDIERSHNYITNKLVVHNSIYQWRNADFRNMLNFEKDFPEAKIIFLEENYRSTKTILAAAQSLILKNRYRHPKDLWTLNNQGSKVNLYMADTERDEARFVIEQLKELLEQGFSLNDFAILYRVHAQSRVIEEALLNEGFPYRIIGGVKFYQRREIKDIIAYLRVLENPNDWVSFQRIYNVPLRGIGKISYVQFTEFATRNNFNSIEGALKAKQIKDLTAKTAFAFFSFGKELENLRKKVKDLSIFELTKEILKAVDYKEYINDKTEEGEQRWENVKEFLTITRSYSSTIAKDSLSQFLQDVALIQETDKIQEDKKFLHLMTLHSAKGLEFPVIFIIGFEDGLLPHSRSALNEVELEEERRLAYVGITRAKEQLFITLANARNIFGSFQVNPPSRFLSEIPEELFEVRSKEG